MVAETFPHPTYVDVARVATSRADLAQLSDRIGADEPKLRSKGFKVAAILTSLRDNRITVNVKDVTDAQKEELERRYPGIVVAPGEYGTPQDDRLNSGGQWKAGIRLNSAGGLKCTANFTWVRNDGVHYVGTAGHCNGRDNFRGVGRKFFHNADMGAGNPHMVANTLSVNPSNADFGVLQWDNTNDSLMSNIEIMNSDSDANWYQQDPLGRGSSVTRVSTATQGAAICMSGAGGDPPSGLRCGTWLFTGTFLSDLTGDGVPDQTLNDMGAANYFSQPGDSGAPITSDENNPNPGVTTVAALGIHQGNNSSLSMFTRAVNVQKVLGMTPMTDSRYVPFQVAH
jgi:hypothetical protein